MKKIIPASLLLFLFACQDKPSETNDLLQDTAKAVISVPEKTTNPDSVIANLAALQKEYLQKHPQHGDTINVTDPRGLKQGVWKTYDAKGNLIKEEWYKDGKLIDEHK